MLGDGRWVGEMESELEGAGGAARVDIIKTL